MSQQSTPTAPDIRDPFPSSTPEEQGLPSAAVTALVDRLEREGLEPHSLMVLRHGRLLAESFWAPYHPDGVQLLYSLSKSFTSTAAAFAEAEGLLDLSARAASHLDEPAAGPRAASLTVHQLLSMSTGHRVDTLDGMIGSADPVAAFFAHEPEQEPGSCFVYNNGATYTVGAIVQRVTGMTLTDYLRPRLFEPLGIDNSAWLQWPAGRELGFSGLHLTTGALARFGQLLLDDGRWHGEQLLPAGWVARASAPITDNSSHEGGVDWQQGYGYQYWRARHGFRGDGAYGQYVLVLPEEDAVVVITSCQLDMQAVLDAVWEELLPAFTGGPLPASADADTLRRSLSGAQIAAPADVVEPASSGPWTFAHREGREAARLTGVVVEEAGDGWQLTVREGDRELTIRCGRGVWPEVNGPWVARGGWTSPTTFEARIVAVQTPHHLLIRCDTDTGQVSTRWNGVPLHDQALSTQVAPPSIGSETSL
ncbi:serine hydrolase [Nakamurella sp. YIM 132087]|uniref:Serine hydrolase n=1 Tax=Nakamurella alba TaxID=2665158 RepID=A0A7K1FNB7_9ACTN|nr:serine hydrolase [Nakamurella alba]MTD14723.1 serine hydrolase [Nakamurella alba]